jgi:tRNA-dihydrouridine synthase
VEEAGVAAIAFHPRPAAVHHRGTPDYELAARLVGSLAAPVVVTGGLSDAAAARRAFAETGAEAVMLARGSLGNPWLFAELLEGREEPPTHDEVLTELRWVLERAGEHMGDDRAPRYLRKFYPWYVERLDLARPEARRLQEALQRTDTLAQARALLAGARREAVVAA